MTDASFETKFAVLETLVETQFEHMNQRLAGIERVMMTSSTDASTRESVRSERLKELHDKIDAMTLHMTVAITKMQSEIDGLKTREAARVEQQRNTSVMVWGAILTALGGIVTQTIAWLTAK